ncbi:hypothetical protein G9P44_005468 [Scheffersomyces stipitis]|nr:hypothetical protein G9P44_005468 [Scheffersomyces stipitis]
MKDKVHMNDSNIAVIKASVGGVGHNISLASHYFLSSKTALRKSKFVSIVGNDFAGRAILNQLKSSEFDASGILVTSSDKATAQYSATHDSDGNLVVAAADMSIIEEDFSEFVIDQVSPQVSNIVFDCNLSPTLVNKVMNSLQASNKVVNVIIEPTSLPKSSRIAKLINRPFPNNFIKLITPTVSELEAIHASFYNNDKYDDYDEWFPVLDSLGVDSFFRDKLNLLASKRFPVLKDLMDRGTLQQSFQLVPFFQNILIKIGSKGAIMVSLSENVNDYKSIPTTSKYKPAFILASEGRVTSDNKRMGVVIEYFPIPMENENLDIINVTGAGDSMLGTLVAQLSNSPYNWLATEINSVEQEWSKWEHIYKAQLASGLTLTCESAVSSGIQLIE